MQGEPMRELGKTVTKLGREYSIMLYAEFPIAVY
jgi:hypothetical protein